MNKKLSFLFFALVPGLAHALDSQVPDGLWSSTATWGGSLPTPGTPVNILAGHTVTVDTPAAEAGVANVYGTLRFSTVTTSTLRFYGDIRVRSGGRLEMGTETSPIPAGVKATLILPLATTPGSLYNLHVDGGGSFVVQGAPKSSFARAQTNVLSGVHTAVEVPEGQSQGWSVGDVIVLGKTNRSGLTEENEEKTILSTSTSSGITTVSWSGTTAYNHHSTATFIVANLSRNALVRSAGTIVAGSSANTAYITVNMYTGTTLRFVNGEFAHLGDDDYPRSGIHLSSNGSAAFISSCTFRNGYIGLNIFLGENNTVQDSLFYGNFSGGLGVDGASGGTSGRGGHLLTGNAFFANGTGGLNLDESRFNTIRGNVLFGNFYSGLRFSEADQNLVQANDIFSNGGIHGIRNEGARNTFVGNRLHANNDAGVDCPTAGNLFVDNDFYGNATSGVNLGGEDNVFVSNRFYENRREELTVSGAGHVLINVSFGFDASGTAKPGDGAYRAIDMTNTAAASLVLKSPRFHGTEAINSATFSRAGNFLLSFNRMIDSTPDVGIVRLWGDHTVSGTTLALNHASDLYEPSATIPKVMRGAVSLGATVVPQPGAVSQLITLTYGGGVWAASGSVSGLMADPSPQFTYSISGSPYEGDRIDFVLMGASGDAGQRKRFLFHNAAPAFNGGRSRLTVAPSGGLTLRGVPGTPALVDRAESAYGTLVSSGAFTAENALLQNLDAGGVQLSGADGVSISSTTFDNAGLAAGDNAYITVRDLSSSSAFYNVVFGDSRLPAGGQNLYNIRVTGGDAGLAWSLDGWSGSYAGPTYESDPNGKVRWLDAMAPSAPALTLAAPAGNGAVRLTWTSPGNDASSGYFAGTWRVHYSTDPADLAGALPSQAQAVFNASNPAGATVTRDVTGLLLYATHYFQVWAQDETPNTSPASNAFSALPPLTGPQAVLLLPTGQGGYLSRTATLGVGFDKPVTDATVPGAFRVRRVRDNQGTVVDEPLTGIMTGTGQSFSFAPSAPLAGNSVYSMTISSGVLDAYGAPSTAPVTALFTTVMSRDEENLWTDGQARIRFARGALARDGYASAQSLPASSAALATRKLQGVLGGDPFAAPVGGVFSLTVNDESGGALTGNFAAPVEVSLPFSDVDNDGVVDGTTPPVRVRTLAVHWLDDDRQVWHRLPTSRVDAAAGRVTARAPHFTVFSVIGQAETDLTGAHPYPNPYRAGSGAERITFTRLGSVTSVRIYTPLGDLVRELSVADGSGTLDWDLKNQGAEPVASGLYLYKITSGDQTKTGHLAVLR